MADIITWQDKLHSFISSAGFPHGTELHARVYDELGGNRIEATREHDEKLIQQHAETVMNAMRESITQQLVEARLGGGVEMLRTASAQYSATAQDGSFVSWPQWLEALAADIEKDIPAPNIILQDQPFGE